MQGTQISSYTRTWAHAAPTKYCGDFEEYRVWGTRYESAGEIAWRVMTWLDSTGSHLHDYWVTAETFEDVLRSGRGFIQTAAEACQLSPEEKQAALRAIDAWEAGLAGPRR